MTILLLGVNHHTASTDLRGRLTFSEVELPGMLARLQGIAAETVVLSTCNRTEIYAVAGDDVSLALVAGFSEHTSVSEEDVLAHCYRMSGEEAVHHLMSVASGLDSVVLGEPQILGQVRDASEIARTAGASGPMLNALFRFALETGKDVRSHTLITRGATSIAHAAVELGRRDIGDLTGRSVLVLGAGETGRVTALNLRAAGVGRLFITNRNLARAEALAGSLKGEAVPFERLPAALSVVDMVVSCSSSREPLVTAEMLQAVRESRSERQLLLMDIAVPRNIEASARDVPCVILYDMDDIQALCERNKHARAMAARRAERNIRDGVDRFLRWQRERDAVPMIRQLRDNAEQVREAELTRVLSNLSGLSEREREAVEAMSHTLVNRLLHQPVVWLKQQSTEEQRRWLADMWALVPDLETEKSLDADPNQPL